jgi:hypothetical protein
MKKGAKVTSIAALREFRPALIKFIEEARASLTAAESEALRTLEWLRNDRQSHWKREIRLRTDDIVRCKTELFNKQRSATGDPRSAVEERKALDRAKARLEEAQQKAEHTKRWLRQLEKEHMQYKGIAQSLSSQITALEDRAMFDLDRMATALEDYVALTAPSVYSGDEQTTQTLASGFSSSFANTPGQTAIPSPVRHFRQATPTPGRRRRAEERTLDPGWPLFQLARVEAQLQADALAGLHPPPPPSPEQWITASPEALASPDLYLERCEPTEDADSGWYLAALEPGIDPTPERRELDRLRVADLLARRPDLAPALGLDRGSLLVVRGAAIESVTAPNDTLVYARNSEGSA